MEALQNEVFDMIAEDVARRGKSLKVKGGQYKKYKKWGEIQAIIMKPDLMDIPRGMDIWWSIRNWILRRLAKYNLMIPMCVILSDGLNVVGFNWLSLRTPTCIVMGDCLIAGGKFLRCSSLEIHYDFHYIA